MNPSASRNRAAQSELPREEMLRDWLEIETPEPSYYDLLGLPELETDEKAVLQAGRRVKRKVRAYQIGLYRKQALSLLSEIGQAVSTLTNPEKKRDYDNALMGRWRAVAEELAQEHLRHEERTPAGLEAWLTACRERGIPVTRLMPYLMRRVMVRAKGWPAVGAHQLPFPIALWTYRDTVVLGQCLQVGTLEKRVESVKKAQKLLAVPQGLALMVAGEVGRAQHLFRDSRLVRQAQDDPDRVLWRLGRRIRRYGGELGKGKVPAAIGRVLGKKKEDLDRVLEHIDEPPVDLPRHRAAARAARRARQHVRGLGGRVAGVPGGLIGWIADRPQILVPLAVLAGVASLFVAVLVVAGVVQLYGSDEAVVEASGPASPLTGGGSEAGGPSPPPAASGGEAPSSVPGTARPESPPLIEASSPEWLKHFRDKYPAERPPAPVQEEPPSDVKFFGVKGEKRADGSAVEVKSGSGASP